MARVALHLPATDSGVIQVEDDNVDRLLSAGWEQVGAGRGSGRRRTDTGSIPTTEARSPRAER